MTRPGTDAVAPETRPAVSPADGHAQRNAQSVRTTLTGHFALTHMTLELECSTDTTA